MATTDIFANDIFATVPEKPRTWFPLPPKVAPPVPRSFGLYWPWYKAGAEIPTEETTVYTCPYCGETFATYGELQAHIASAHPGEEIITEEEQMKTASLEGIVRENRFDQYIVLPGAKINVANTWQATADAHGQFSIRGIALGIYSVTVSAEGYTTKTETIDLSNPERKRVTFYLSLAYLTANITIRVVDQNGTPIPRAKIVATGEILASGRFDAGTYGSNGEVTTWTQITGPGTVELTVSATGFETTTQPATINPGDNLITVTIVGTAPARASIVGVVVDKYTRQATPGVKVDILLDTGVGYQTTADSSGHFAFIDFPMYLPCWGFYAWATSTQRKGDSQWFTISAGGVKDITITV